MYVGREQHASGWGLAPVVPVVFALLVLSLLSLMIKNGGGFVSVWYSVMVCVPFWEWYFLRGCLDYRKRGRRRRRRRRRRHQMMSAGPDSFGSSTWHLRVDSRIKSVSPIFHRHGHEMSFLAFAPHAICACPSSILSCRKHLHCRLV